MPLFLNITLVDHMNARVREMILSFAGQNVHGSIAGHFEISPDIYVPRKRKPLHDIFVKDF